MAAISPVRALEFEHNLWDSLQQMEEHFRELEALMHQLLSENDTLRAENKELLAKLTPEPKPGFPGRW